MDEFLKEANVGLLWEVIIDENVLSDKSPDFVKKVQYIFFNNMVPFYEEELKRTPPHLQNLFNFNKNYILSTLQTIRVLSQPVTAEAIKEENKNRFEMEVQKKRADFDSAFSKPIPNTPTFNEKIEEAKPAATELEKLIQQTMAERNYDIEHREYSQEQAKNWLNSKETSVKNEKLILNKQGLSKMKPIKIHETEKHVQWDNEQLEDTYYFNDGNTITHEITELKKEINELKKGMNEIENNIKQLVNSINKM